MMLLPVKHTYTQLKSYYVRHFTTVSFACLCNKKYRRCYDFLYQFFYANLSKPVFKTFVRDFN